MLSLAQEEAQRFQHNYIGTEHILLGLVRQGDSTAGRVLNRLGVELNSVRDAVELIIGRGDRIVLGEIGLTPRAKKVIELAVDEARRVEHEYVETEHILLGLVREGQGIAAGVLESLGVKVRVRNTFRPQTHGTIVEDRDSERALRLLHRDLIVPVIQLVRHHAQEATIQKQFVLFLSWEKPIKLLMSFSDYR
jgi:ATP-dependent Clp protease ATP-binding subunit ClpA